MARFGRLGLVVAFAATLLVHPQSAAAASGCSSVSGRARYVVCVDISSQTATLRRVTNGRVGSTVIGPYMITSSRVVTSTNDSITRQGHFLAYGAQRITYKKRLEFFIEFYNGQGLHAYPYVGPGYDSHGCVREQYWAAQALWNRVVAGSEGNLVSARRLEVHIYP